MAEVVWTNHLRDRARERQIDPVLVDKAIRFPDKVERSRATASQKHIKVIGNTQYVAAVKREGDKWIVTSVWSKPYFGPSLYKQWWLERLVGGFVNRFFTWLEKRVGTRL